MLTYDPQKRIDINGIKNHKWFKGKILSQKELITEIPNRRKIAEKKRRMDVRKMNDLAMSIRPNGAIPSPVVNIVAKMFPQNEIEGIIADIYTYLHRNLKWYEIYYSIEEAVTSAKGQGDATYDWEKEQVLNKFIYFYK